MRSTVATTALAVSLACTGIAAAQDKNVKIGVMTDMAGLYSDISGINSVLAVTKAVEDSGLREKGWKIDIISGDHQNKPDVATSLARQWADVENVDLYADVVTSSTAGVRGSAGLSAYVASKHAVVGMMRTAALEGAAKNIRVNSVNPSPVETAMIRQLESGLDPQSPEQGRRYLKGRSPLGRYAEPDEIAGLMLYLASDEARFITGAVHMIDGGRTAM